MTSSKLKHKQICSTNEKLKRSQSIVIVRFKLSATAGGYNLKMLSTLFLQNHLYIFRNELYYPYHPKNIFFFHGGFVNLVSWIIHPGLNRIMQVQLVGFVNTKRGEKRGLNPGTQPHMGAVHALGRPPSQSNTAGHPNFSKP